MPYTSKSTQRRRLWKEVMNNPTGAGDDGVVAKRLALVGKWQADPWNFLTARDLDGTPIINTVDERDEEEPIKPFPFLHSPEEFWYLEPMVRELFGPLRIVLMDKARQIYATTLASMCLMWFGMFYEEREIFVSRVKEESAIKLINDKVRTVHKRMPRWVQEMFPVSDEPKQVITFKKTGSTITGVSQNFAVSDARGPTASIILVDEAAYQDYFPEIYQAVLPMTGRLWGVTTANIGSRGAKLYDELIHEGRLRHVYETEEEEAEVAESG